MGLAIAPVLTWLGGEGTVASYQVRFTKPVYVPSEGSAGLTSVAKVTQVSGDESSLVTLTLTVTADAGQTVLGKALVVVVPR